MASPLSSPQSATSRAAFVRAVYSEARKARLSGSSSTNRDSVSWTDGAGRRTLDKVRHGVAKVSRQMKMVEMWASNPGVSEDNDQEKADDDLTGGSTKTSVEQFTSQVKGLLQNIRDLEEKNDQLANESIAPVVARIIEEMIIEFEVPEARANEIRAEADQIIVAVRVSWDIYSKAFRSAQEQDSDALTKLWNLSNSDVFGFRHKPVAVISDLNNEHPQQHLCNIASAAQRKLKAKVHRVDPKVKDGSNAWHEKTETKDVHEFVDGAYDPGAMSPLEVHINAVELGSKSAPAYKKIKDAARIQLIFDSAQRLLDSLPHLRNTFRKLAYIKNHFGKPGALGWRDISMYVQEHGDHGERCAAEVQLVLRNYFDAQSQLEVHFNRLSTVLPDPKMQKWLILHLTGTVDPDLQLAQQKHENRLSELDKMRQTIGTEVSALLAEAQRWVQIHSDMQDMAHKASIKGVSGQLRDSLGINQVPHSPGKVGTPVRPPSPLETDEILDEVDCDRHGASSRKSRPPSPTWPPRGAPPWGSGVTAGTETGSRTPKSPTASPRHHKGEPLADKLSAQKLADILPDLQDELLDLCGSIPAPKSDERAGVSRSGAAAMLAAAQTSSFTLLGKMSNRLQSFMSEASQRAAAFDHEAAGYRQKHDEILKEARNISQSQLLEFPAPAESTSDAVDTIGEGSQHVDKSSQQETIKPSENSLQGQRSRLYCKLNGIGDFEEWPQQSLGKDMSDQYMIHLRRGLVQLQAAKVRPLVREELSRSINASQSVLESSRYYSSNQDEPSSVQESHAPTIAEEALGVSEWCGAAVLRIGSPLGVLTSRKPLSPKVLQTQASQPHPRSSSRTSTGHRLPAFTSLNKRRQAWAGSPTSENSVALTAANLQRGFDKASNSFRDM
eukprot:gnl/MRDRNA2_/MRDRNA2_77760_c0_seq1.p1 gnl/MRDRNA2_/MRDRNA2_77760_c0~~gnl/MRDRNA2_/MRDRNA2_77760_c0_seq1.p1  ORF type:complete len:896 (-),score=178.22 gnl/MRDRNA2_/MRDRNA2_77760_c0_seq1:506-3193(-)